MIVVVIVHGICERSFDACVCVSFEGLSLCGGGRAKSLMALAAAPLGGSLSVGLHFCFFTAPFFFHTSFLWPFDLNRSLHAAGPVKKDRTIFSSRSSENFKGYDTDCLDD